MKLRTVIPDIKVQNIYGSRDTPFYFCWHQHFFTRNKEILLYQEMQIYIAFWYIISNSFNLFWSLKIVLINAITNLIMSAKMATLVVLNIKIFWNKGYDVTYNVANKILSRESNYFAYMVMWPKFVNSSVSMREVMIASFL